MDEDFKGSKKIKKDTEDKEEEGRKQRTRRIALGKLM